MTGDFVEENFDAHDFSAFLDSVVERLDRDIPKIQNGLAERAIDESMNASYATMAAKLANAAEMLLTMTAQHEALVRQEKQKDIEEMKTGLYEDEYMLDLVEKFMLKGMYTAKQLRFYLEDTQDFTEDQIRLLTLTSGHDQLLEVIKERMRERGERPYVHTEGQGRSKEFGLTRIEEPLLPATMIVEILEKTQEEERVPEQTSFELPGFSLMQMTRENFSIESMAEEHKTFVQLFLGGVFDEESEKVLGRDMKQRIVDAINNRRVGIDEAHRLLEKSYQAHLVGKTEIDDQVYFVTDVTQRRNKKERARNKKTAINREIESIDFKAMGIEHVFDVMIDELKHVQQRMTPDEISKAILGKGYEISPEQVKLMVRSLDQYFHTGEFSQSSRASPHAKSRGRKTFKVSIKNQDVKDRWRNNRAAVMGEIDAIYQSKQDNE